MFKPTDIVLHHLPPAALFLLAGVSFWLSPTEDAPPVAVQTEMDNMRLVRLLDGKKMVVAAEKMLRHGDKNIEIFNSEIWVSQPGRTMRLRSRRGAARDGEDSLHLTDIEGQIGDGEKFLNIRAAAATYQPAADRFFGDSLRADTAGGYFQGERFSWDREGNLRVEGNVQGRFAYPLP